MNRLAHVYTRLAGHRCHFQLPDDYDAFRAWIAEHHETAMDAHEFDRQHDIVKWYLSHMSFANQRDMFQIIVWADHTESPVTVEHHRYPTGREDSTR
ncbi:hypothetical protein DFR68_105628 [Nocardia mexicana]|uniref:Uncharacterized protein n=1 Tax=Nocardia mexicana TaxID=279262 RepID=A0A370H4P0_9NOCA|nr:hypothetical protein DFR68_105628 [Nocardia mexicana]